MHVYVTLSQLKCAALPTALRLYVAVVKEDQSIITDYWPDEISVGPTRRRRRFWHTTLKIA